MKVIITGCRDFSDYQLMRRAMSRIFPDTPSAELEIVSSIL